jgi:hypothetical protein
MVVYVCCPRASATNAAALRVDGGMVRSIVVKAGKLALFFLPPVIFASDVL